MMRVATRDEVRRLFNMLTLNTDGSPADSLTRAFWLACAIIGCLAFVGSFGCFLLPIFYGWTWFGAMFAFGTLQLFARPMLYVPEAWVRMIAWMLLLKNGITRGRQGLADWIASLGPTPQKA